MGEYLEHNLQSQQCKHIEKTQDTKRFNLTPSVLKLCKAREAARLCFAVCRSNSICFEWAGVSCVHFQLGQAQLGIFKGHALACSRFLKIEKFSKKKKKKKKKKK